MTVRSRIRSSSLLSWAMLLTVALGALVQGSRASAADKPAAEPPHQVIACYFHRTVRCPTCRMISAYIEEALRTGFASQMKDGTVKMVMMDFQDPRNQRFTQAYQITGPTLVLMDVRDGKVASWKPAPKVWSLVGNKGEFFRYVQGEVKSYLEVEQTAAR
jgi:hypothetical protein